MTDMEEVPPGDPQRARQRAETELAATRQQVADLTAELDATNRGLIALHAELDDARQAEARLAVIVRSSDDAMVSITPQRIIETWNPAAQRLLGYTASEIVGHPVDLLMADEIAAEFDMTFKRLEAGDHTEPSDTQWRRADGTLVDVAVVLSAIRATDGALIGVSAVLRDITDRKRMEDARQEFDDLKDAFLRTVAHDLRGPLATIAGIAQLLADPDPSLADDNRRVMAGRVAANAARLDRLVSDLLDFDRVSRGALPARRQRADVADLARTVTAALDLGDHPLHLDTQPAPAHLDPTQVERIIENLVANAARHTPTHTPIWVRVAAEPAGVLIIVDDAGPGVPDPLKHTIFHPYQRSHTTGGAGIGLSLVARFAELHGGRAWVQDRPQGGASFRVLLPSAEPGPEPAEASVLIVEDDPDFRMLVRLILDQAPDPVRIVAEATTGEEALSSWEELRPDVVILDVRLPGDLNGIETARRILRHHPAQPIVLCSTDPDAEPEAATLGIQPLPKAQINELPELLRRSTSPHR